MEMEQSQPDEEFVCPVCLNLLLEPTTVTCGHNVCRGCLAGWYLSNVPRRHECPTCRQKWEGYPQVNKTLRNLIERLDPQRVAERRKELAEDPNYQKNVDKFEQEVKQKKAGSSEAQKSAGFFAGIAVAMFAVIVIYFFTYWGGSGGSTTARMAKPAGTWGTKDVEQWMESLGWARNYSHNAHSNSVDGTALLYNDLEPLITLLDITDDNHKNAFRVAVDTLRDYGIKMPQTLWEYWELYPGWSLFLSYGMKDFPRCAMLFLYLFSYEDSFLPFIHTTVPKHWEDEVKLRQQKLPSPTMSQWLMFWLMMLVFPYGMIGLFAWSLRSVHTITHLVVMATCFIQTLFELSFYSSCLLHGRWRAWKMHVQAQMKQIMSMLMYMCLWPVTPSFICSAFFYVCLYYSPVQLGKTLYNTVVPQRH